MHINNEDLFYAIAHLKQREAMRLMQRGAEINGLTDAGDSIWSIVVPSGIKAVKLAIDLGADVNALDNTSHGPLYWAIFSRSDSSDVAEFLFSVGATFAEPLRADKFNLFHVASQAGNLNVLDVFLRNASKDFLLDRNCMERTPLEEALASGHADCAKLIDGYINPGA